MDNNTYNSAARRRSIVTPAERKAAEARKLAEQNAERERRLAAEKATAAERERIAEAKRRETEARRRSSVKTSSKGTVPPARTGAYPPPYAPAATPPRPVHGSAAPRAAPIAPSHTPVGSSAYGTPGARGTMPPPVTGRARPAPKSERELYEQQQQLLMQQRQIEMLERQMREEKERRSAVSAQHRRIAELEYQVQQQQILRENMIDKDAAKDIPGENAKMKAMLIGVCIIAVLIIINIIAFSALTKKDIPDKQVANTPSDVSGSSATNGNSQLGTPEIEPATVKQTVSAKDYTNGVLVLVNSEHPYDFDNEGTDIRDDQLVTIAKEIKDGSYKASNYKTYLNSETVKMLNLMMTDFYTYSKRNDVMVNIAHRTYEQQKETLDSKAEQLGEDQKIAQAPGNSEHHTGYAFDFSIYPKNENGSTFINIAEYTWIYENCHKYGFVLRYPEGKTAITGIDPESWHFRYVGIPHATYMYQKNRTLEEYLSDLTVYSENIPLTINVSDTESYSIFYVSKTDASQVTFSVPKDTEYMISGDNIGGFVVWYNNADIGMKGKVQPAVTPDSETDATENADAPSNETDSEEKTDVQNANSTQE